jgi:hypothetical protein
MEHEFISSANIDGLRTIRNNCWGGILTFEQKVAKIATMQSWASTGPHVRKLR